MVRHLDKTRSYTVEEFMALPDDGRRYELIEGKLIDIDGEGEQDESASHNLQRGRIITRLVVEIAKYLARQEKIVGEVLTNVAFELAPQTVAIPAVAFVRAEKLAAPASEKAFPGAPDLAVEVISPNDTWSVIISRVRLYQQYQIGLVWIVDPFDKGVIIFRPDQPRREVFAEDDLSGEEILPGFTLPVKTLFN